MSQRNSPARKAMLEARAAEQRACGDRLVARRREEALAERRLLERMIARDNAAKAAAKARNDNRRPEGAFLPDPPVTGA